MKMCIRDRAVAEYAHFLACDAGRLAYHLDRLAVGLAEICRSLACRCGHERGNGAAVGDEAGFCGAVEVGEMCIRDRLNAERVVTSDGNKVKLLSYLKGKKVADIAATKDCFIFLLEDGEVLVQGASRYGETDVPVLPAGEKLVSISAGANHIVGISDAGTVYAWGSDSNGQCKVCLLYTSRCV